MSDFKNTRKALEEFDADRPRRDALCDNVANGNDVYAWEAEEMAALDRVREAFYLDTKEINSHENCMQVDIDFMRRMANRPASSMRPRGT